MSTATVQICFYFIFHQNSFVLTHRKHVLHSLAGSVLSDLIAAVGTYRVASNIVIITTIVMINICRPFYFRYTPSFFTPNLLYLISRSLFSFLLMWLIFPLHLPSLPLSSDPAYLFSFHLALLFSSHSAFFFSSHLAYFFSSNPAHLFSFHLPLLLSSHLMPR